MARRITKSDFVMIMNKIVDANQSKNTNLIALKKILDDAETVDDHLLPSTIVRLGSIIDLATPYGEMKIQVVLPETSNSNQKRISIFTPLGYSALGYSVGEYVSCTFPNGEHKVLILNVTNN